MEKAKTLAADERGWTPIEDKILIGVDLRSSAAQHHFSNNIPNSFQDHVPMIAMPASLAASIMRSRSSISVRPASTASAVVPVSRITGTVS